MMLQETHQTLLNLSLSLLCEKTATSPPPLVVSSTQFCAFHLRVPAVDAAFRPRWWPNPRVRLPFQMLLFPRRLPRPPLVSSRLMSSLRLPFYSGLFPIGLKTLDSSCSNSRLPSSPVRQRKDIFLEIFRPLQRASLVWQTR